MIDLNPGIGQLTSLGSTTSVKKKNPRDDSRVYLSMEKLNTSARRGFPPILSNAREMVSFFEPHSKTLQPSKEFSKMIVTFFSSLLQSHYLLFQ